MLIDDSFQKKYYFFYFLFISWQPSHAVEALNGNFIISFWSGHLMDKYGIFELNAKGHSMRRAVYNAVSSEFPMYMSPGNDNWVFVASPDTRIL